MVFSRSRYIFAIVRLIFLLINLVVLLLTLGLVYYEGIGDFHIAMKIFIVVIIVFAIWESIVGWYYFLHFYPSISMTPVGVSFRGFFGILFERFYTWDELTSFKTDSFAIATMISFSNVRLIKNGCTVIRFDEASYDNYEEMLKYVEQRMDGKG